MQNGNLKIVLSMVDLNRDTKIGAQYFSQRISFSVTFWEKCGKFNELNKIFYICADKAA